MYILVSVLGSNFKYTCMVSSQINLKDYSSYIYHSILICMINVAMYFEKILDKAPWPHDRGSQWG